MRMPGTRRFIPLLILLSILIRPGLAATGTDSKTTTGAPTTESACILLIDKPELWIQPEWEAAHSTMDWPAGRRLDVDETRETISLEGDSEGKDAKVTRTWRHVRAGEKTGWLPDAYLAPPPVLTDTATNGRIGEERVDRYSGLAPDYAPNDLIEVGPGYDDDIHYRLRKEAAGSLKSMIAAARADGVKLYIVSAYRPWETQQRLYQRRIDKSGWDQDTVARPGHSEHQLGTAIDLTDGDEETLLRESFGQSKAGRWLRDHAWTFGFAISYADHNRERTGYQPEPWHYRYWGLAQARRRHQDALGLTDGVDDASKQAAAQPIR